MPGTLEKYVPGIKVSAAAIYFNFEMGARFLLFMSLTVNDIALLTTEPYKPRLS